MAAEALLTPTQRLPVRYRAALVVQAARGSSSEWPQWTVVIGNGRNRLHIYAAFEKAVGREDCL